MKAADPEGWLSGPGGWAVARSPHPIAPKPHARQTNSRGQDLRYTYDAAGQLARVQDIPLGKDGTYVYDLSGNRIREKTVQGGVAHQANQFTYDALGRPPRSELTGS